MDRKIEGTALAAAVDATPAERPAASSGVAGAGTDIVLHGRDLTRSYGDVLALDGVDVDIAPGEVLGLLGPNGAGKTTLLSLVAGLRVPDRGSVHICGVDVQRKPLEARKLFGIAPQELAV